MNTSEYNNNRTTHKDCSIVKDTVEVVLPILYFLIFVPALVLNIMVAWVLLHLKSKSTFMVYLKNLVVADLLMTLTLPIKAGSKLRGASLGLRAFTCQFTNVLFYHCMYISIIQMGLISLDRFFKIVRPFGSLPGQSLLFSRVASAAIWLVMLGTATLPSMALTNRKPSGHSSMLCMHMKRPVGRDFHMAVVWVFNLLFWIVLVQIGFCYTCIARTVIQSYRNSRSTNSNRKLKTKAKVFTILVVFLVCFTPYHILRIPYTQLQLKSKNSCTWESVKVAKDFALWLSTTNICLDPLIYFYLCKSFRKKLSELYNLK